jgi:hypothetical protein
MGIALEAHKILDVMLIFTWPVIVSFVMLALWSASVRGGYTSGENLTTAFAISGIISVISMFFFLNVEGGEITDVMRADPAWGMLVGLVVLHRAQRSADVQGFIQRNEGPDYPSLASGKTIMGGIVWILAAIASVIWLHFIAASSG